MDSCVATINVFHRPARFAVAVSQFCTGRTSPPLPALVIKQAALFLLAFLLILIRFSYVMFMGLIRPPLVTSFSSPYILFWIRIYLSFCVVILTPSWILFAIVEDATQHLPGLVNGLEPWSN